MGIAERREREKEEVRTRIVEAARDIVSEAGVDALSMRAIAERIEYSPATIYLYFQDKDELIKTVCVEGFRRMGEYMKQQVEGAGPDASGMEAYRAVGLGYVNFALENATWLNVMFKLPRTAKLDCGDQAEDEVSLTREATWECPVSAVQRAVDEGEIAIPDAERGAVMGWALVHGLVSLYVGGHLADTAPTPESFGNLVEEAMHLLYEGWKARPDTAVTRTNAGLETMTGEPA